MATNNNYSHTELNKINSQAYLEEKALANSISQQIASHIQYYKHE